MSVKFEKESVRTTTGTSAPIPKGGKHDDLVHDVGEALTRGGGANGYLQVR